MPVYSSTRATSSSLAASQLPSKISGRRNAASAPSAHHGGAKRPDGRLRHITVMDWARILAYVTGTVDQELLYAGQAQPYSELKCLDP